MTKYARAHDMDSWLRDPRIATRGFADRWQSSVAAGNGEDAFIALVDQYLRPDCAVLDLGCGHGEFTLTLAARCRTIVGIEREPGYLELAKELAAEQTITNVQFFQVNLAGAEDEDRVSSLLSRSPTTASISSSTAVARFCSVTLTRPYGLRVLVRSWWGCMPPAILPRLGATSYRSRTATSLWRFRLTK